MASKRKDAPPAGRRRLGRGLGSLLSTPVQVDTTPAPVEHADSPRPGAAATTAAPTPTSPGSTAPAAPESVPEDGDRISMIAPDQIHPNPRQPRRHFDETALQSLADSIRTAGLMQPIVVRSDPAGGYQIVAGERRWRAASRIGLERVPTIIRKLDDQRSAELALIENLQREDLNPIERATAFQQLIDDFGLLHQEIAECVGLERSTITNHLRLLELDDPTLDAVKAGTLTLGHAKALLGITNLARRQQLASAAIKRGWSVRELERRTREAKQGVTPRPPARSLAPHLDDLQTRLGEHLGTKVAIQPGRNKNSGRLVIEFYGLDEFDGLMERLGLENDGR